MKKLFKKMFCILISLLLVLSISINSCYAAPVVVTGLSEVLPLIGKILVTVGASAITYTDLKNLAKNYAMDLGETEVVAQMKELINSANNGVVTITDAVWTSAKNWVDNKFQPGDTAGQLEVPNTGAFVENVTCGYVDGGKGYVGGYSRSATTTSNGKLHTLVSVFYKDMVSNVDYIAKCNYTYDIGTSIVIGALAYTSGCWGLQGSYINTEMGGAKSGYIWLTGLNQYTYTGVRTPSLTDRYNYGLVSMPVGVVGNSTWTYTNNYTGKREIALPPTYIEGAKNGTLTEPDIQDVSESNAVGKTYTDIQAEVIPTTDTGTGTVTDLSGVLSGIAGVRSAIGSISYSIERFFDLSQSIEWEPLKVAGSLFTNRFPFSLPWDLYNSFATVASDAGQPDFNIVVPKTPFWESYTINIDLSQFGGLLSFAKTMELLAFDIGLILITRKILGGDA